MMDRAGLLHTYCLSLLRGARLWRQFADRSVDGFGMSGATAYPLVFVARLGDGLRQTALAEALGIEGPSLVRLLDQLCAAGLLQRREDPGDKRARTLHLTQRGTELAAILIPRLDDMRERIFAGIDDADICTALRVFGALDRATTDVIAEELTS